MPTLQFKGKNTIWNHHLAVPYYTLEGVEKLDYTAAKADPENLIIEGDNLLALKALLPQYGGRIKCIYIDPPYNTGNENWIYNDNVNHPLFKTWLGQTVGKDDLTRHDKWLCMMTPRLKLLKELLAGGGIIFVSISDVELHNLKQLMGEIFGEENFIACLPTVMNLKGNNDEFGFAGTHQYTLVYSRDISQAAIGEFFVDETELEEWEEDEYGPYKKGANLKSTGVNAPREKRPNLFYPIFVDKEKNIYVTEDDKPPQELKDRSYATLIPLTDGEEMSWRWSKEKVNSEKYNIIVVNYGEISLYKKQRPALNDIPGKKPKTILYKPEYSSGSGTAELKNLVGAKIFDNPKPLQLIKDLILLSTKKDDIVLDSFAGSGTTMQAVMELNKDDGGNRTCILIQMTEAGKEEPKKNICKDITRKRIKRAIDKYQYKDGFRYVRVGISIDAETMLQGGLPTWKQFAAYVYYLCTGTHLKDKSKMDERSFYAGSCNDTAVYLVYKKDFNSLSQLALNLEFARAIVKDNRGKRLVVYAPSCFVDDDFMRENNIEFVGIPYDLFRRTDKR